MKIINSTHWRTDHLRAFVSRLAKEELCDRPQAHKLLKVHIGYTRPGSNYNPEHGGYSSGCAYIGGFEMTVRLAKNHAPDKVDFAHVVAHELAHIRGMRHPEMRGAAKYRRTGNWRELYAWANDLPLEVQPPKAKPDRTLKIVARENKARESLERWERKFKLAKTKLRLWTKKVRYYERKTTTLPVAATEPPQSPPA